jgi:hypothetical protein
MSQLQLAFHKSEARLIQLVLAIVLELDSFPDLLGGSDMNVVRK